MIKQKPKGTENEELIVKLKLQGKKHGWINHTHNFFF